MEDCNTFIIQCFSDESILLLYKFFIKLTMIIIFKNDTNKRECAILVGFILTPNINQLELLLDVITYVISNTHANSKRVLHEH